MKQTITVLSRELLYAAIVAGVSSLIMGIAAVQYADYVDRKSNQRWCGVVTTLDEVYRSAPPQTTSGQVLAHEMAILRREFRCK